VSAARRPTLLVPLGCYLAVTVGVPLLNGAGAETGFIEHSMWVVGACGIIAVSGAAVACWRRR